MSICTILSPVAVPTSFEGPFGKIVYRVKAVIDTPRFSKDYKAQRPFYLLNLLNLNEVPDIEVSNWCTLVTSRTTVTKFSNALFFFSCYSGHLVKCHHSFICPPLSLCSSQVTLWQQRSSTTSWWKRGRWCSKPAVTWGVTSLGRWSS